MVEGLAEKIFCWDVTPFAFRACSHAAGASPVSDNLGRPGSFHNQAAMGAESALSAMPWVAPSPEQEAERSWSSWSFHRCLPMLGRPFLEVFLSRRPKPAAIGSAASKSAERFRNSTGVHRVKHVLVRESRPRAVSKHYGIGPQ